MVLPEGIVKRTQDPDLDSDAIKVFDDGSGKKIQAIALVDSDGNHVGMDEIVIVGITNEVKVNLSKSAFDHGSKSGIGVSAVQIKTDSIIVKHGVVVKSSVTNSGVIYVGNSDVTANTDDDTDGFELFAGESVTLPVDNVNKIHVIASETGQKAFWVLA